MVARVAVVSFALFVAACFSKPERVEGTPPDAPVTSSPDARPPDPNACVPATCPGVCAADGFCEIQGDSSGMQERCPRGVKCRFVCATAQCKGGVSCKDAAACEVSCIGTDACQGGVDCGMTPCTVICDGESACEKGIKAMGPNCTASCCGTDACKEGVGSCTPGTACD